MSLNRALASYVSSNARNRGAEYFAAGAVTEIGVSDGAVWAVVVGSDDYDVRIEPDERRLLVSCTCPYFFDSGKPCKHIWAALLAADEQRLLVISPDAPPLELASLDPVDEFDDGFAGSYVPAGARVPQTAAPPPLWRQQLDQVTAFASHGSAAVAGPAPGSLVYVLDIAASQAAATLVVEVMTRDRKANGEWGKPRPARLSAAMVRALPDGPDRHILERLLGGRHYYDWSAYTEPAEIWRRRLDGILIHDLLPAMCATDRCVARVASAATDSRTTAHSQFAQGWQPPPPKVPPPELLPLVWDDGPPWEFVVTIRRDDTKGQYVVEGMLARGDERMSLADPVLVSASGVLLTRTNAARLDHHGAWSWLLTLCSGGSIAMPLDARPALVDALLAQSPRIDDAPTELRIVVEDGRPSPVLRLTPARQYRGERFDAEVIADYGDVQVLPATPHPIVRTKEASRVIRRDLEAERGFVQALARAGFRREWSQETGGQVPRIPASLLPRVVRTLLAEGWRVEAGGITYRQPGSVALHVSSGIDWFELAGHVDYGDIQVSLPALLAASKRGDGFVPLGDGSMGLLPEQWLQRHGMLARLGETDGDSLKFRPSQAALLDALLAAQPEATCDELFARARRELTAFDGIAAADPPPAFTGALRGYQRDGLGWLLFLRRFGFGGCLADDMGLGKTVMILALLARIHQDRGAGIARPSLVVTPRSLVFNWRREAERFTPGLRVLDYTGGGRAGLRERLADHDVVLTTYGTVRRDAAQLAGERFEYVVLDESQAVKNASSASAKAVRLLKGAHRLALSGTPVENHLGELWSLFEFLNPGLLGSSGAFAGVSGRSPDAETVATLGRGLRPFILRRTKAQVAVELPEKTEQTIHCELKRPQRALYDQLRDHYRRTLLDRVAKTGLARAKLQVLEALLRLRQAACHPGLIDPERKQDASAKLDVLVPRVTEAVEEGHKTLVFSQFTSLLAILRERLDAEKLPYEYLDGRTRDRQAAVDRFQTDPGCRLFLISLKAGGVGLNLTAAEYVFLLDPWWNPAVEAQAIDRAHRIGQSRQVFAYRLIAKDTVEERVLELQQRKRSLADAILSADESVIRTLKREDLELLLS